MASFYQHMASRLDSKFDSFSSFTSEGDDVKEAIKPDAIHKAVMRESWFSVSKNEESIVPCLLFKVV